MKSKKLNKNIFGLYVSLTSLILGAFFNFYSYQVEFELYLNICGILLIASIVGNIIFIKDYSLFSPFFIFSLVFCTYSLNAFYISSYGIGSARFLELLNIPNEKIKLILKESFFVIQIYYYFFSIGTFLYKSKTHVSRPIILNNTEQKAKIIYKIFGLGLFTIGSLYFIGYSYSVAAGPIDLLKKIGSIAYLERTSRAPLLLCFNGVYIYAFYYIAISKKERNPFVFWGLVISSFIIYLSSGRISLSIRHLLFIVTLLYITKPNINLKFNLQKAITIFLVIFSAFGIYFLRVFSSIYSANINSSKYFSEFDNYFSILAYFIIGKGNLLDVQQFVSLSLYLENNDYLYGQSIIQAFFLSFYQTFNIEYVTPGIIFKNIYFKELTGAPVAGAIVELIMNFGYTIGAFIFMAIGYSLFSIYQWSLRSNKLIVKVFYAAFFSRFLLGGYLKVDSSALNSFVWLFIPLFLVYSTLSIFISTFRK